LLEQFAAAAHFACETSNGVRPAWIDTPTIVVILRNGTVPTLVHVKAPIMQDPDCRRRTQPGDFSGRGNEGNRDFVIVAANQIEL
jgi:hypothetical protein